MPPCSISSPEKMKNGIARNEKTFIPEIMLWKAVASGRPSTRYVRMHDNAIAKATGTPSSSKSVKLTMSTASAVVNTMMAPLPCC